jgi:spermidine/putrescine transport system ATP-binding protein
MSLQDSPQARSNGADPAMPAIALRAVTKSFRLPDGGMHHAVRSLDLDIRQGEFFTLLGPSGCGKTTTLRMIAGFETPNAGTMTLMGRPVHNDPAYRRNVNTVFQNYALFPHMSVADNVAFGMDVRGVARAERDERVSMALESVRMSHAARHKPASLSGGQQQRIALARALVNRPAVLLLDEPFGALDLKLRREMQLEVKDLQRELGITFIFVTHDQEEALTMSDRIAVMDAGHIRQIDDPVSLYDRPRNRFTAEFIGDMNFFDAEVSDRSGEYTEVSVGGTRLRLGACEAEIGETVVLAFRPENVRLAGNDEGLRFRARVRDVIYIGTDRLVDLTTAEGHPVRVRLRPHDVPGISLEQGSELELCCHSDNLLILEN